MQLGTVSVGTVNDQLYERGLASNESAMEEHVNEWSHCPNSGIPLIPVFCMQFRVWSIIGPWSAKLTSAWFR